MINEVKVQSCCLGCCKLERLTDQCIPAGEAEEQIDL